MVKKTIPLIAFIATSSSLLCVAQPIVAQRPEWLRSFTHESRLRYPTQSSLDEIVNQHNKHHHSLWPTKHWYDYLPPCPDSEADVKGSPDWVVENKDISQWFHPNATSYRSVRAFRSPTSKGDKDELLSNWHGQQACYSGGKLLTDSQNPGAGSPDFEQASATGAWLGRMGVPADKQFLGFGYKTNPHFINDVAPFLALSHDKAHQVQYYSKSWPTQRGTTAPFHVLVGQTGALGSPFVSDAHPQTTGAMLENMGWRDTMLDVSAKDKIVFKSQGTVKWGILGEQCDADGDPNTENKVLIRERLGTKRPFPDERIGTLVGVILPKHLSRDIIDELPSLYFKIGRESEYEVPDAHNGRLWVGINDSETLTNTGYFDVEIRKGK